MIEDQLFIIYLLFLTGSDQIVVSGSGMVQATILEAMDRIKYYHKNSFTGVHSPNSLPRLNLDIPHAVLSFLVSIKQLLQLSY